MKLKDLYEQEKTIRPGAVVVGGRPYGGTIDYSFAKITELDGKAVPREVGIDFLCHNTKITSLVGCPDRVGRDFFCQHTLITSAEGAPKFIGRDWRCHDTRMQSLNGIHKEVKHIGRLLAISDSVRSHILGVMLIKGLKKIKFDGFDTKQKEVEKIINKYLDGSRDPHACQEEMIEAGLGDYAKL